MLTTVQQARHRIFGTFFNPTGERTGRKYLKKKIIGPELEQSMQQWSHSTFRNQQRHVLWHMLAEGGERELLAAISDAQVQGLNDRERSGKLPPKKGQGKRSSRKK